MVIPMTVASRTVKDIFVELVGNTSPDQWDTQLANVCDGDDGLRDRVQALLRAHAEPGDFLERPAIAAESGHDEAITEAPGTVIGPYRLLEQIGEGGFGVVFWAEQERPVRRTVALKVIKPGMDTRQVIARFEAERQALALMQHPNIAHVLDAGATEKGRPYFVMELVRGIPLTEFCDQHRLTVAERLQLFVTVCQAVQHAHQKGIIHRDLKPSNVLVTLHDGQPVVKVIDFGVAKATGQRLTEKTLFTGVAQMVGTPLYMSPEQASGVDIDTRSDIYSLGVMLYELLTGTTPFDKERLHQVGYDDVWRIIREEEPPKPSTRINTLGAAATTIPLQRRSEPSKLAQLVRGELDWIVMKALEKDRNRRYETASGLARDAEHYLRDEPVQACPPSVWYRFRKFARRNKRTIAAATVLGLALFVAVGAVAGTLGWVAHDRSTRELIAEREASRALNEAIEWQQQEKWPAALSAVKRAEGLLAGESESELSARVGDMRRDVEMVLRLESIMLDLQSLPDSPTMFDFAKPDTQYAKAFQEYGIDVDALETSVAVEQIGRREICVQLAVGLDAWAEARRYSSFSKRPYSKRPYSKHQASGHDWRRLIEIARLADPDPWRVRVREALLKRDRQSLEEVARQLPITNASPVTLGLLGRALSDLRINEPAEELLRRAQRRYPTSFWLNYDLAMVLFKQKPAELDDGIRFLSVALALRPDCPAVYAHLVSALTERGASAEVAAVCQQAVHFKADSAVMHLMHGVALAKNERLDEAIAAYRAAVALKPHDAGAQSTLGGLLRSMGRVDEALPPLLKAVELDPKSAFCQNSLGRAFALQKKLDDAIDCYNEAIRLKPDYSVAHDNLGRALAAQGKLDEAVASHRKAIALDPERALGYKNYAVTLKAQGKKDEAIAAYQQAIRLKPDDAVMHYQLGSLLIASNRPAEAKQSFQKALDVDEKNPSAHNTLAWILATSTDPALRDAAQAVARAKKAVELAPKNGLYWNTLGVAQYRAGDWTAAVAALEKSAKLRNSRDSFDGFFLAMAHWHLGDKEQARKVYDHAVSWMDENEPTNEELRRFRTEAEALLDPQPQSSERNTP